MSELINHVDELVREIGPRRAGTRAENQASEFVAHHLEQSGLLVREQGFSCSKDNSLPIVVELLLAVLAAYLLFFQPALGIIALILALLSVALFVLGLLDQNPLSYILSKNSSQNVIARYLPAQDESGGRKRKVVVVAHYDSQQTAIQAAPFLVNRLPIMRLALRVAIATIAAIALLLLFPFPDVLRLILASISLACGIVALVALISVIVNMLMPVSMGANCNGSGVAVLIGLAQRLTGATQQVRRSGRKRDEKPKTSRSGTVITRGGRRERSQVAKASQMPALECGPLVSGETATVAVEGRASSEAQRYKRTTMERTKDLDFPQQEQPEDKEGLLEEENAPGIASERKPADFYSQSVAGNLVNSPFIKVRPRTSISEEQEAELEEKRKRVQEFGGQTTDADGAPAWYTKAKEKAEAKHKDTDEQQVVRSQYADVPTPTYSRADQGVALDSLEGERREDSEGHDDQAAESWGEAFDGGATQAMPMISGEPCALELPEVPKKEVAVDNNASRYSDITQTSKTIPQSDFSGFDKSAFQVLKDDTTSNSTIILPTQPAETDTVEEKSTSERINRFDRYQDSKQEPREKLRDLPSLSAGLSERIPVQQAGLDTSALTENESFMTGADSMVNLTGSFAPLGATGVMKPIGEELLEYSREDEIYIHDADDSSITESYSESGSYSGPDRVSMPRSRFRSFFGDMGEKLSGGRKKREKLKDSPSQWLGVDEDYDARKTGSSIGSWDNFNDDDDSWNGGAYGARNHKENVQALMTMSEELFDKEVWLVGLGASGSNHAGMKAFLKSNASELRGALIINVVGVGAGDLVFSVIEGTFRRANTDHRLQNIAKAAGTTLGIDIDPLVFNGFTTDATTALHSGARAISILGVQGKMPAGWRWSTDKVDLLEERNLQDAVDVILEMIKNS